MIPTTIYQTYSCDYKDLPSYIKNCTETWKEKNPDFNYIYMSEEQCYRYILENYGHKHASIYSGLSHKAMKGDWWRYLIINKNGGVYMDIDTVCRKPLSSVLNLNNDFITSLDLEPNALFTQWGFASKPGNKILDHLIKYIYDNYDDYPQNKQSLKTDLTGPTAFQNSIRSVLGDDMDVLVDLCNSQSNEYLDFAQENSSSIEETLDKFHNLSNVKSNKFKLHFWTFDNAARHFTASWRWSDNTLQNNMINKFMKHKCNNINYEYSDVKIYLKNKSYSSFGSN